MDYQPLHNYGVIGDMRTAALVGLDGSIDWFCVPRFDSPSVFARILDARKGGHFSITATADDATSRQLYWPDTNVLVTRYLAPEGAAELTDFMPVGAAHVECREIIRRVTCVRGEMKFRMECRPAFNYARDDHTVKRNHQGVIFDSDTASLTLMSELDIDTNRGGATAEFTLAAGESAVFVLRHLNPDAGECIDPLTAEQAEDAFRQTVSYWRTWIGRCTYRGRWREMVTRSALALKLLTYEPTGAIVAAPTCSLPEEIGGVRNWDYRYTWIRDSAFTMYALLRLGFVEEAGDYMKFLAGICQQPCNDHPLQVMYAVDGRTDLHEETLDHLDGYRGSKPVRIGNDAYMQLQLDIYGELMDAAYLYNKWGEPISADMWESLHTYVDWICHNWHLEDEGIWEVRGGRRHFVYSKLMCWVAVDRGIRLAEKRSFPYERDRWHETRDAIYREIFDHGWNEQRKAFVQAYGSDALDAANLLMPLVFFMSPTDPKMLSTLDETMKYPSEGGLLSNSLVFRYNVDHSRDGIAGEEGTFNICTFWLVEALTRAGHYEKPRLEEARLIFERMLGFANTVGLYAEETGLSGEALGNYPQAFTHLSLISAAFNLDRALGEGV